MMHGFGFMPFMVFSFFGGIIQVSLFVLLTVGIVRIFFFRGCRCMGRYNTCNCGNNCNCEKNCECGCNGDSSKCKCNDKSATEESTQCKCEEIPSTDRGNCNCK